MSTKRKFATFLRGDTKWTRHKQRLDEAVVEINQAEIVAIDLEFSGLFASGKKQKSVEEYYLHCAESVPQFLAVQLGLCTARRDPNNENKWILSPFNFHLFPNRRKVFMSDSLSLSWLLHQGFDLTRWIEDGYDYRPLGALQREFGNPANDRVKDVGAQRLIDCIIEQQKPVVVHNGMLDLLHVYEKFVCELPRSLAEFCRQMTELFPAGVYDTKRIAESGRLKIFRLSDQSRGATSLDSLRFHLSSRMKSRLRMTLNTSLFGYSAGELVGYHLTTGANDSVVENGVLPHEDISPETLSDINSPPRRSSPPDTDEGPLNLPGIDKAHEAGFDAMITLQIFLLELEWIRQSGQTTPEADAGDSAIIPKDWAKLPFCQQTQDCVEVVGIPPGMMELRGGDYSETQLVVEKNNSTTHPLMPPPSSTEIVADPPAAKRLRPGNDSARVAQAIRDPVRGTYRNLQLNLSNDAEGTTTTR